MRGYHAVSQTFDRPAHRHLDSTESQSENPWRDTETLMKARAPHGESSQAEDEIDRVLRERFHFRRLSQAEVNQLSDSQFQRLQDEYDVARAREIMKAIRQGRMEVVSGQELKEELDRICQQEDQAGIL